MLGAGKVKTFSYLLFFFFPSPDAIITSSYPSIFTSCNKVRVRE